MDQLILSEKLESLRRCIARIEDKTPANVNILIQDPDIQDILILNLTRAVQLCVDIGSHVISESQEPAPQTMGEVFTSLSKIKIISTNTSDRLKKAVGFRNIAFHNYETISWEIVFATCKRSLEDFRMFAREIGSLMSKNSPP